MAEELRDARRNPTLFVAHMAVLLQSVKGKRPIWEAAADDTLLECMAKITFFGDDGVRASNRADNR
ncbi:hypothetical protein MPLSOD_110170 [Mesorhizobium sp. SOD10]|nr:hypothetical protein MPLSOD_110170 [Mesorhizobium sp. SOD10]